MATILEMQQEQATILSRADEIEKAAQDEARELTTEEDVELDEGIARHKVLDAAIAEDTLSRRASRRDELAALRDRKVERTNAPVIQPESGARTSGYHERIDEDPKGGFGSLGGFFKCSMQSEDARTNRDPLMRAYLEKGKRVGMQIEAEHGIEATAGSDEQSFFSDRYGGVLVPDEWRPNLLTTAPEGDPVGSRTTKIPMVGPIIEMAARVDKDHSSSVSGGLTVRRVAEGDQGTVSRVSFETVRMELAELQGITYATKKMLRFSPISFAAMLQSGFGDEMTGHMIDERLNGTGAGEFLGVRNSGVLITVAKETSPTAQAADTITYDNIIAMRSRAWRYNRSIWLANHDTLPQLMTLEAVVGVGGSRVWQPSAVPDHPDTLLGRPIVFSEYMQTLGDEGDLMLCDWAEYLEAQPGGMDASSSIHVRFLNSETTFLFSLMNAGTPWWRTALTPKNSTSTLGPFITLAARD